MQTPAENMSHALERSDCAEPPEFDAEMILQQVLEDPSVSQFSIRHGFEAEDTLSTYVRCDFAEGQQRYILHVPFYPHFGNIPQVTATIFDENAGRARVTDQQKFGSRVEITLDGPTTSAQRILVEVIASAPTSVSPSP